MKLKDKKIEILAALNVSNGSGYFTETLTPIGPPVWAYFRHLSGKEIFAASAQMAVEEVLFTINYRPDITPTQVIRYNGALYDITRVDSFEGYKDDLTLYAKRRR
ncbi:phage head closure protein [Bacillota bacterium Meth-B3]